MGGSGDVPRALMNRQIAQRLPAERSERFQPQTIRSIFTGEEMRASDFARLHPKTAQAMGIREPGREPSI